MFLFYHTGSGEASTSRNSVAGGYVGEQHLLVVEKPGHKHISFLPKVTQTAVDDRIKSCSPDS